MTLKNDIKNIATSQGAQMVAMTGVETYIDYVSEVKKRLQETGADKVAVITGGFHSEPFKNYFSSKDYTYALISPKLSGADKQGYQAYVENTLKTIAYSGQRRAFRL